MHSERYNISELTSIDTMEAIRQSREDPSINEVVTLVMTINVSSHSENPMIHTPFLGESTLVLGTSIFAMQTRNPDKNVREELLRIPRPATKRIGKCKCKKCGQECFAHPVFYGLRKSLLFTSIFVKYMNHLIHETHLALRFRGEKPEIMDRLEANCEICIHRPELLIESSRGESIEEKPEQIYVTTRTTVRKSVKGKFTKDIERSLEVQKELDERKQKKREAIPIYKDKILENLRIRISDSHRKASWYFMMRVASGEVMRLMPGKQQANYTFVKELGIFFYSGRLL